MMSSGQLADNAVVDKINALDSQFEILENLAKQKFSELLGLQNEMNRIASEIDMLVENLEVGE